MAQNRPIKITAGYPTLHPSDRHMIRMAIDEYHRDGRDSFKEEIAKLDPDRYFKNGYLEFSRHDPRQNGEVSFVFKHCTRCFDRANHSHCSVEQESWVWKEAIRRGDDDLFVPIIESHPNEGWLIMLGARPPVTLPKVVDLSMPEKGLRANSITDRLKQELQERGWGIEDVEPKAAPNRIGINRAAIIDYERAYPVDVFHPLYSQSFDGLVGWGEYSDRTKEEIEDRECQDNWD